jgi:hypothetical protein
VWPEKQGYIQNMDSPVSGQEDLEPKANYPNPEEPPPEEPGLPINSWTEADWLQIWLKLARERKQAPRG